MEFLLNLFSNNANRCAIRTYETSISYGILDKKITEKQHLLFHQGVLPGKIVPFVVRENMSSIVMLLALFRMRAIAAPINRRLSKSQIRSIYHYIENTNVIMPKEACLCLQTSGSSGTPKMALLSYSNLYYGAYGAIDALELDRNSSYLLSLPLHHIAGIIILFRVFLTNSTLVLPSTNWLRQIKNEKITHLSFVPTQLYRLLQQCDYNPIPSVTHLLLGGASISPYLHEKIREFQLPVLFSYGMTEMSSTIAMGVDSKELQILPYRKVSVSPSKEVLVRGSCLFLGYLTKHSIYFTREWFHTKDMGSLSPTGNLQILGRKDRMFISAGENIHPEVIETALCTILGVEIATVVAIPDREYGQRMCAFIKTKKTWKESRYMEILRLQLSSLFLPVRLFPMPQRDAKSLKIDYTLLQRIACKALGIEIGSI